jgi:multidrug efflux pump subunit AcrA (membrane-fusion protein)
MFAPEDGLVVYASTSASAGSPIEEGATVRLRQEIIKLPDISSMLVDVKVHETFVNQIKPGLLAYVTIDSQPERRYVGTVRRVAPLPDTSSRYYNPNLKVYSTEVIIEEPIPDLKPGVSAHSEIVITNLANIISVPIQAVTTVKGKQVVFLADGSTQVPVEVGFNNDRFIEIKSGLKEGQQILLSAPVTSSDSQDLVGSMVSSKEIEEAKDVLKKAHAPKGHGVAKGSPKSPKPAKPAAPQTTGQ